MSIADLFKRKAPTDPETTPKDAQDALVGIDREAARLHTERDRLAAHDTAIGDARGRLNDGRPGLAFRAKVDNDPDAARTLADQNAERHRLDDEQRDTLDAIAQIDARLDALKGERREAERASNVACVGLLCREQAELAEELDRDFSALVARARRWIELDMLITSHTTRIGGVSAGRGVLHRLQDVLASHVYPVLPDVARASAVDLHIGVTEAHRGATFAGMSQQHGPAGMLARTEEAKEKSA